MNTGNIMETADLLNEVQLHNALFDPSNPGYTDAAYKETLWKEIGLRLNQPGDVCRNRWNNVRDTYRKVLKRRSQQPDDCAPRKYRYEDQLSFLTPFLTDKEKAIPRSYVDIAPVDAFSESPKHDELLIAAVQSNPHLYDISHVKYNDLQTRNDTWKVIGDQLNIPGAVCRLRWRSLRNSYRKWLNHHSGKTDRKHRYDDLLVFLKPFLSLRDDLDKSDYDNTICSSDFVEVDYSTTDSMNEYLDDDDMFKLIERKRPHSPQASDILRKRLCMNASSVKDGEPDGLSHFMTTIELTLRQLSPTLLNLAKTEIFTVVQKYELEHMEKQKNSADEGNNA